MMRQKILLLGVMLTVVGGILAVSGFTSSALAERGDACKSGACGSATFQFSGRYEITGLSMSVKDTECDDNDVYIKLRIYDFQGTSDTVERRNSSGCKADYARWPNLSWLNSRAAIKGVRVIVCVNDFGSDTCYRSRYIDNPNT
jgi:hypothetical protein